MTHISYQRNFPWLSVTPWPSSIFEKKLAATPKARRVDKKKQIFNDACSKYDETTKFTTVTRCWLVVTCCLRTTRQNTIRDTYLDYVCCHCHYGLWYCWTVEHRVQLLKGTIQERCYRCSQFFFRQTFLETHIISSLWTNPSMIKIRLNVTLSNHFTVSLGVSF